MARNVVVEGTITRVINSREVKIPFYINGEEGTYFQWELDTLTIGQNVDLLERLRDAILDTE